MDTRLRLNIGLLIFIILLSLAILMSKDEADHVIPRLTKIDQDDILKIEILRKNIDNLEFNRVKEVWYMISPYNFLASTARINAMLRLLDSESHGQLNRDSVDLARFNLIDPAITLKLNDHLFNFGNTDAIDTRRYILFNEKIHLIDDSLYMQLTTNATFFADPKILPTEMKIDAIQFPSNRMELINDNWQTQKLIDMKPEQLKKIVFSWNEATAVSVSKYMKPVKKSSITVSSSDGITIKFFIVSTKPYLILGREDIGIQYHLGNDESEKLLLTENL